MVVLVITADYPSTVRCKQQVQACVSTARFSFDSESFSSLVTAILVSTTMRAFSLLTCKGGFAHFLGLVVTEYIPGPLVWLVLPNSSRKGTSFRFPEGVPGVSTGLRTSN